MDAELPASPWGPWRARVVCAGLVAWLGGVDHMLLGIADDARFLAGWLVSAAGLGSALVTLLSAAVSRRPARRSFPGTVLAVPRTAGVPPVVLLVVLGVLGAGIPLLMARFLAGFVV